MSKRLQITLPDDVYMNLIEISEALHYANKSGLICCSIDELYKKLKKAGLLNEK